MTANGGYAGHGETYVHPDDVLWWSKGGVLHGDSWKGIAFLKAMMADTPAQGLTPIADMGCHGPAATDAHSSLLVFSAAGTDT
jgi:hypothetical protein